MDSDSAEASQSSSNAAVSFEKRKEGFWDARFIATIVILFMLTLLAAYLEYVMYPETMANQFSATHITLHLTFLSYSFDYLDCQRIQCTPIQGLPAFDFVQLFVIVAVICFAYRAIQKR